MYAIDARHFLNDKGDIGPERGPGRKMADVSNWQGTFWDLSQGRPAD